MSCRLAIELVGKDTLVPFRQALSKAFSLIQEILQAEQPETLWSFFDVLIRLQEARLPEVVDLLRSFLAG